VKEKKMQKQSIFARLRSGSRVITMWTQIAVLAFAALIPALWNGNVSADQLTSRSVTLSSSRSDQTGVTYTFGFTLPAGTDTDVEGLMFEFCTTPLGTCVLPTGMDVTPATAAVGTQSGFPANGTAFSEVSADTGDCDVATDNSKYCVNRTETTTTGGSATPVTLQITNITNPTLGANPYLSVYIRISVYDNSSFDSSGGVGTQKVHDGTVAGAINALLVVSGRVQERLEFCVAAVERGAALPANCAAAPLTTTIDIGVVDNARIARAPEPQDAITGANNSYGIAMVNTNASNGVSVQFLAIEATSGTNQLRSFRVPGATCDATASNLLDQCFVSASAAGDTFTVGNERFGMAIGCIDQSIGTTTNLGFSGTAFNGNANANCATADNNPTDRFVGISKFAWNTTTTPATIAASSSVVDDEVLLLTFAATASSTTPTGAYTATSMYIATPTF
jgi:hypothetical protein